MATVQNFDKQAQVNTQSISIMPIALSGNSKSLHRFQSPVEAAYHDTLGFAGDCFGAPFEPSIFKTISLSFSVLVSDPSREVSSFLLPPNAPALPSHRTF